MGVSGQHHAQAALYPRVKDPRYPLYRRLGGPRVGLDTEAREKILFPCRGSNPDRPVVQPVVRHYTAWATRLQLISVRWAILHEDSVECCGSEHVQTPK
jgi:hypothetical protein